MKRPNVSLPRRPRSSAGAVARNSKEAAIQLVRLEFDAARLELGAAQAEARAETHRFELAQLQQRRIQLVNKLNGPKQ